MTVRNVQFEEPQDKVLAVRAALAAHGFGETERAALRAFWHSADLARLGDSLADGLTVLRAEAADVSPTCGDVFVQAFQGIIGWELDPDWPLRLSASWLALYEAGGAPDMPARAAAVAMTVLQGELIHERSSVSRLDAALLQIIMRVGLLIAGLLAKVSNEAEAHARWLAEHVEPTSGLPNRVALISRFEPAGADGKPTGLLVVGLQWGESAVLLNTADRDRARNELGRALLGRGRADDSLFRVSDDDWVLWAPGVGDGPRLELAAAALLEAGEQALRKVGLASHASLSVGAAVTPRDGDSIDAVLNAARRARVAASRIGRSIGIAGPEIELERNERVLLEREFIEAMRNNEFGLHLQPIIQVSDGGCLGGEALLRWQRSSGQWVPPPQIVSMAEQFGLMQQLTRLVLQRAAAMLSELQREGVAVGIAVNLAGGDLRDPELPEFIAQALATWRVPPDRLTLELTEGSMIADDAHTLELIARLRSAGYGVALDDFGTGYSSLAWLRRLPATRLKIDRMFVQKMPETPQDRAIVSSVIQLAQGLGLRVVAEGVEREEQLRMLMAMGCDAAQGFLIARPMAIAEFIAWWTEWERGGRGGYWASRQ
ncbi:hypothetical protein GCM10025771_29580 [Niveibacterium umoris]|uniref:EAL domain-containing protein (Putative c-di-GMP-specific phosphodiesterase class I)/GGDEF domain-containing protein n=1 Tax=Niveibacterium umoris TaxID=1193620 RepID=A0A840BJU9_9RHOO|nr:GGDEF domain-containing phosphodiesterase [Niveibacterium umoris]MBB4011849.1 EAL domain-containing protein (putative c-di-GMP-specific phosphodiesterase class I)/GGDEF domain-containing protein [Niveibacterium umoris]